MRVLKNGLVAVAMAAVLSGCGPATPQGVREAAVAQKMIVVEQGYQQVYRTVLTNARRCWQTGMITATMIVNGDLFTDTRSGEISVTLYGGLGPSTYLAFDVRALSDTQTQVTSYAGLSSWAGATELPRRWLLEGWQSCR